jgi:hypothetical protein
MIIIIWLFNDIEAINILWGNGYDNKGKNIFIKYIKELPLWKVGN